MTKIDKSFGDSLEFISKITNLSIKEIEDLKGFSSGLTSLTYYYAR